MVCDRPFNGPFLLDAYWVSVCAWNCLGSKGFPSNARLKQSGVFDCASTPDSRQYRDIETQSGLMWGEAFDILIRYAE